MSSYSLALNPYLNQYNSGTSALNLLGGNNTNSSIFGGNSNQSLSNLNLSSLTTAIDTNKDGQVSSQELMTFLSNPNAILSNLSGGNQNQQLLTGIMSLLKNVINDNASFKNSQTETNNKFTQQLQAAQNAITAASADAQNARTAAEEAAEKAENATQALVNYQNTHGDEDPKLFAKQFGQLLDANKDAAVDAKEFAKIAEAAGEDLKVSKQEWDNLVEASNLSDTNKTSLVNQVANGDEIDVKNLETQFFAADADKDGKVEAGAEINSFATDVAKNDTDTASVNTGDLAAESFETA